MEGTPGGDYFQFPHLPLLSCSISFSPLCLFSSFVHYLTTTRPRSLNSQIENVVCDEILFVEISVHSASTAFSKVCLGPYPLFPYRLCFANHVIFPTSYSSITPTVNLPNRVHTAHRMLFRLNSSARMNGPGLPGGIARQETKTNSSSKTTMILSLTARVCQGGKDYFVCC